MSLSFFLSTFTEYEENLLELVHYLTIKPPAMFEISYNLSLY